MPSLEVGGGRWRSGGQGFVCVSMLSGDTFPEGGGGMVKDEVSKAKAPPFQTEGRCSTYHLSCSGPPYPPMGGGQGGGGVPGDPKSRGKKVGVKNRAGEGDPVTGGGKLEQQLIPRGAGCLHRHLVSI